MNRLEFETTGVILKPQRFDAIKQFPEIRLQLKDDLLIRECIYSFNLLICRVINLFILGNKFFF